MKQTCISNEEKNLILNIKENIVKRDNESENKTAVSTSDKDYYNQIENMNNYIKENYPKFSENFELLNFINSGSTGTVYEGKIKKGRGRKNLKFAIKFKIEQNHSKETQEISILKKLHQKYITEIYAFIKMNDFSNFCVLELGKYGDLENFQKKLLKRKTLSETTINYFTKQILEALKYLHRCKIIHMDIKQGNILVDSNLNIKLTDFSVSCSYSSFNKNDIVRFPFVGTSKYISPEILGRKNIKIKDCEKIDIYSLGVTLFDLFFGYFPYKLNDIKSKDYDNILKNIQNEKLEFPKDKKISLLFKEFLSGLLEKDYNKRLTIEQALNHPWIQGSKFIIDEKENSYNSENFLINLITDNIYKFNQYVNIPNLNPIQD